LNEFSFTTWFWYEACMCRCCPYIQHSSFQLRAHCCCCGHLLFQVAGSNFGSNVFRLSSTRARWAHVAIRGCPGCLQMFVRNTLRSNDAYCSHINAPHTTAFNCYQTMRDDSIVIGCCHTTDTCMRFGEFQWYCRFLTCDEIAHNYNTNLIYYCNCLL